MTAKHLLNQLSESATVTAAARLRNRVQGKPGLVKISLSSVEEKVQILRQKRKLKEVGRYRNVFFARKQVSYGATHRAERQDAAE